MLIFGHLGIGSTIVKPWSQGLSRRAVLWGTLLPDLIDKPLYHGLSLFTGLHGEELGLISGTRTFGHTALLLISVSLVAVVRRSKLLAALALGMASHLLLDNVGDRFSTVHLGEPNGIHALLWPFLGFKFPVYPYSSAAEHLTHAIEPYFVVTEIVGLGLLAWDFWKRRHESEILAFIRARRIHFKQRRIHRRKRDARS